MSLRPTNGRVFVVPDRALMTTPTEQGAIAFHLPPSVVQWSTSGRVLAAARTYKDRKGRERETGLVEGHRVLFDYRDVSTVREIQVDGQRVLVFDFALHIKAILSEPLPTLAELYRTNASVREQADKLHNSRMLPPPTCEDCIERVANKLGLPYDRSDPVTAADA